MNQYLAQRLREYADADAAHLRRQQAAQSFVDQSRDLSGSSRGVGWTRDELYETAQQVDQ